MGQIRIYELAKHVGMTAKEVVDKLRAAGVEVKSNLGSVDDKYEAMLKPASAVKRPVTPITTKPMPMPLSRPSSPRPVTVAPRAAAPAAPAATPPAAKPSAPAPGSARPLMPPAARTPQSTPAPARVAPTAPGANPFPPAPQRPGGGPQHRPGGPGGYRPPYRRGPSRKPARSAPPEPRPAPAPVIPTGPPRPISITEGVTVRELAEKMGLKANDVLKKLLLRGLMTNVNRPMDQELAVQIALEFNFEATIVSFEKSVELEERETPAGGHRTARSPVVTVMGHVDHGKTSLLDAIRETRVVDREHGGITQHIGAYTVTARNRGITFLDTPGHEAFTLMRARGAKVTDIVVLVVAADDGVMPQTIEAIDHARAAGVPLIVALNKIDKPDAKPDVVKKQLSDRGLLVEDWGGQTVCVPISAKQKKGLQELLEMILLVADMLDLKAAADVPATGTVLEARLDRSRGPVATVLVQDGTLRIGDAFIAGAVSGKVRAMVDDAGERMEQAPPSTPVEVMGLQGVPAAGDIFKVLTEEWKARQIGAFRQQKMREDALQKSSRLTLDHLFQKIQEGVVKELNLIVKGDVHGSVEALSKTLSDLTSPKVKIRIVHSSTGAISESDILLAASTNAIVVGFNVRPERKASELAEKEQVDVRLHTVIYNVANEIKAAMVGMLEPTLQENFMGRAEVRDTFKVPKFGIVAGCMVVDGRIVRNADVRLLRDNVVIYTGKAASLRRFKDDVSEVKSGFECGIGLEKFSDVKPGDIIEAFKVEKIVSKELYA